MKVIQGGQNANVGRLRTPGAIRLLPFAAAVLYALDVLDDADDETNDHEA
jgi:hypothetical protein